MTRTVRRGTAPLEFALVLPLLFTVAVVGWWCAKSGLTKTATASEARRTAWNKRDQADPGTAFDLQQKHLRSEVEADLTQTVPGTNPLGGGPLQASSLAIMTDKTWDHDQYEFKKLPSRPLTIVWHQVNLMHFGRFVPIVLINGPPLLGFVEMDLMTNPRFVRHIPEALRLRAERLKQLPTLTKGMIVLPQAGIAAAELAAKFVYVPPVAAWYTYLATVLGVATQANGRLVVELLRELANPPISWK